MEERGKGKKSFDALWRLSTQNPPCLASQVAGLADGTAKPKSQTFKTFNQSVSQSHRQTSGTQYWLWGTTNARQVLSVSSDFSLNDWSKQYCGLRSFVSRQAGGKAAAASTSSIFFFDYFLNSGFAAFFKDKTLNSTEETDNNFFTYSTPEILFERFFPLICK